MEPCVDFLFHSRCLENSWIDKWADSQGIDIATASPLSEYIVALYYAVATMTSTGYGDIHAYTSIGRGFSLTAMLIGLLLYGYCLASMAATLANLDAPRYVRL